MALTKIQLRPGIVTDISPYSAEGGWVDGNNVRFRAGFPEQIGGWRSYTANTYDGVARSLHHWADLLGNSYIGVGTASYLYVENSGVFYDITPAGYTPGIDSMVLGSGWGAGTYGRGTWGSGVLSLDPTQILTVWSMDSFGEDLICCPTLQELYVWKPSLGLGANLATLISDDPNASSVPLVAGFVFVTEDRHVVACQTTGYGSSTLDRMLVRWCDRENYAEWEPRSDTTAGELRLGVGSVLIGACKTKAETLIWSDKALYSMQFVGSPAVYGFGLVTDGLGLVSQQAAVNARGSVYWMDYRNFFVYSGGVRPLPCPVLNHIFTDFNNDQRAKVFGGLNSEFNEVWWFYPSAGSDECDRYVIFNFVEGTWSIGELDRSAWVDQAVDGLPVAAYDGSLWQHEYGFDAGGAAMESFVESGDFDIGDGEQFYQMHAVIPDVTFRGAGESTVRMLLKQRNNPADSLVTKQNIVILPTTKRRSARLRGRQAVLRIEANGLDLGWRLGSLRIDITADGKK